MKPRWTFILLVLAIALGVLYLRQSRKLVQEKSQITTLQREIERAADQVQELQASKEHLNRQRQELEKQAYADALKASQRLHGATGGATPFPSQPDASKAAQTEPQSEGFRKMLSKMMQDPETRKVIRDQQRMVMDQLYAPLVKKMGLTPEESERFKDLLAETTMKGADRASSLFGGENATNRTEVMATLAVEHKASEEQMKELLGETHYAQFKDYQQTAGERMQLNLFKQQLSGEGTLTDQQTEQLLTLLQEEKRVLAAVGQPVPGVSGGPEQMESMFSPENTEQLLLTQESLNQRVYERAQSVLSPDQLSAFARFQTNQIQLMRMGMTMARKFMGAPESQAAPAP